MTEQEATELIATKLMGWKRISFDNTPDCWINKGGGYLLCDIFDPFNDSNYAKMVKNELCRAPYPMANNYLLALLKRVNCCPISGHLEGGIFMESPGLWLIHNTPDEVCMWAVVDVLKETEK